MTNSPDPDAIAARRVLLLLAGSVTALAIGLVVFVATNLTRDSNATDPGVVDDPTTQGPVTEIGPAPGTPLGAYLPSRNPIVEDLRTRRSAVVSFNEYLDKDEVAALVGPDIDIRGHLVALPGTAATLIDNDFVAWREVERQNAQSELASLEELAPSVEDPQFAAVYQADIARLRRVVESAAIPEVVFGVVVVADADQLAGLADLDAVRLVDVGRSDRFVQDPAIRGLRPEETLTAGQPATRP